MTEREQMVRKRMTIQLANFLLAVQGGRLTGTQLECERTATEFLNFTDSKGNKLLGIIAEDQSLPKNPYVYPSHEASIYLVAKQDMLNANFMKVVKD